MRRLDESNEVLCFVAGRVTLNFLYLLGHPGALHFPQPLLQKAVISEEGRSVGVNPAVNVGFMQPVLLDLEVADIRILFIKPILTLMACSSSEVISSGLDDIPQFIPPCLHGGIITWSLQVLQTLGQLNLRNRYLPYLVVTYEFSV
ncbi:unnamed protein product [Schistocephalus solidus]|uniref:DUF4255 domain-containing protein n=1 Tax=Schistocephalus solidus TaxID=70667 RepID=A0A183SQL6_SCHSO|nr:unnamed protein product [Schistocephalus solidus]